MLLLPRLAKRSHVQLSCAAVDTMRMLQHLLTTFFQDSVKADEHRSHRKRPACKHMCTPYLMLRLPGYQK